jgi:hypothetical protein
MVMDKIPSHITSRWLIVSGACDGQVRVFRRVFGKQAPLTLASIRKAQKHHLPITWMVERIYLTTFKATWYRLHARAQKALWRRYDANSAARARTRRPITEKQEAQRDRAAAAVYRDALVKAFWAAIVAQRREDRKTSKKRKAVT